MDTAFLRLGDRLRDLSDPVEMAYVAAEIMGVALKGGRSGYGTVDPVSDTFMVGREWLADGSQPLAPVIRLREFGSYVEDLKRGETVVIGDTGVDNRSREDGLDQIEVKSFVNHPLIERGRLVAIFFVACSTPREWSSAEVNFIKSMASRTRDATERRRVEHELRDINISLEQQIAERTADRDRFWSLSSDIMVIATFDGRIVHVNPAWNEVLGWTERDLRDHNFFDLIHSDDMERTREGANQLERGGVIRRFDNRFRHCDGSYRWISWAAIPGGDRINAVGRDITFEKIQADALAVAEERLRQSQKLESLGHLTGGVAHDFNNLLSAIQGSIELARRRCPEAKAHAYFDHALSGVQRGAALTARLLAFARKQDLRPSAVPISALVESMSPLLQRTVGEAVTIRTVFAENLWLALVDANQLENALLNLCANARDAMGNDGTLLILGSNHTVPPAPTMSLSPGNYVRLSVVDTGVGMDEETVQKAREPFFTTKERGKGTGLGLSMVHGLVAQSGGGLDIRSRLGEGTTVELWLPVAKEIEPLVLPLVVLPDTEPDISDQEPLRVLVVDDDPLVLSSTQAILQDLGHTVVSAHSGRAALVILSEDGPFDIVVTDQIMPRMTGTELATALRPDYPHLPVLLVSGFVDLSSGDAGQVPRLGKPFSRAALAKAVATTIRDKAARAK